MSDVGPSRAVGSDRTGGPKAPLIASIIIGVLTMGGTLAGNLVDVVSGIPAVTLAVSGAVLAGTAAIVTLLLTGPRSPVQPGPGTTQAGANDTPRVVPPSSKLHPLAVIRSMRLGLGCVFLTLAPFFAPEILDPTDGLTTNAERIMWASIALLISLGGCAASLRMNFVESSSSGKFRLSKRGAGFDAVLSYTAAAGLGIMQASVSVGQGLAMAGLSLILVTMVGGAIEEDLRKGAMPVLLVALGAGAGIDAAHRSQLDPAWIPLIGLVAAVCVPFPAILRGRSEFAPGVLEFVPCLVAVILALTVHGIWAVTAAAIFLSSATYSWMFAQPDRTSGETFKKHYGGHIFLFQAGAMISVFGLIAPIAAFLVEAAVDTLAKMLTSLGLE